jgi:hypothetical protein
MNLPLYQHNQWIDSFRRDHVDSDTELAWIDVSFYYPGWIAGGDAADGDVVGNDRPGRDNATVTDFHPWIDDRAGIDLTTLADPGVSPMGCIRSYAPV